MQKSREELELKVPMDLQKVLVANPEIMVRWKGLTPVGRRDFITWIQGAKQTETRLRRIEVTRSKLADGKRRPCCYAVVPMNLYKALTDTPKAKVTWKGLTPMERRDFVGWIEEAKDKEERGFRIEKACLMLAHGKPHP